MAHNIDMTNGRANIAFRRQGFQAIQLERDGRESILDTFTVTKRRSADRAYEAAEELCRQARKLPHNPAAYVREIKLPLRIANKP